MFLLVYGHVDLEGAELTYMALLKSPCAEYIEDLCPEVTCVVPQRDQAS